MAAAPPLDPFALARGLVAKLEQAVNEYANPVLRSGGFAKGANKAVGTALVAKKLALDLRQRSFEALDVPSRSDFMVLADQLQAIEDRMIGMQATLDRLARYQAGGSAGAALPAPPRTRKPAAPQPAASAAPAAPAPTTSRKRARKARS